MKGKAAGYYASKVKYLEEKIERIENYWRIVKSICLPQLAWD
jgi:hypothetical protein